MVPALVSGSAAPRATLPSKPVVWEQFDDESKIDESLTVPHPTAVERVQYGELIVLDANATSMCRVGECVRHLMDQYEVIRFGSLSLETQLLWRDFRNLSTCTIFCGGLSYGHRTT
jgi:hypothetical protein